MPTPCEQLADELADIVDGDRDAIARHADHLSSCDECRDARFAAERAVAKLADAGADHAPMADLAERVLARIPELIAPPVAVAVVEAAAPKAAPKPAPKREATTRRPRWLAIGAIGAAAAAAATVSVAIFHTTDRGEQAPAHSDSIGRVAEIERAAHDGQAGITVRTDEHAAWRPLAKNEILPAGASLATDERTRASLTLADGTHLVLDHQTEVAFDPGEARRVRLAHGRLVADVAHVENRPAAITTPTGQIDVVGTRFSVTATDTLTSVQVVRGAVVLRDQRGHRDDVRAGEEGTIEDGRLSVTAAPQLAREVAWSELEPAGPQAASDEVTAGLGSLKAYKPGESRDRDWNLALAKHDVKVRIVGPIARTEITETFRNDSANSLEGVYQFPLPADAQIDGLSLDNDKAPGGFVDGAFVDKERAQKIWKGVIDKATPHPVMRAQNEIIWVPGRWRDPALLDWQRGGRFELRVYPIPAKGQRTIKLAYTQVVTPRGTGGREYVYPLAHSRDGSTVADELTVDVEVRGAAPGQVRAAGYDLVRDPARADVNALVLHQSGFVPRGDLVVDYRAVDGDAELRAWTFAGGTASAPDEKLAAKHGVGIDPLVVAAQRTEAADARPTAVLALQPKLPRWRETVPRDYAIVVDSSQSMVGERYARATALATAIVEQMDRRDRVTVLACDSECRRLGGLRTASAQTGADVKEWLGAQPPAGASDVVAAIRTAAEGFGAADPQRERWVIYVGDGFASTGFRRTADVERALADTTRDVRVTTIGIGSDADSTLLAAAARGGGGSFLAWTPGQRVSTTAVAALDTTYGAALRDATVTLPAGLVDVAPSALPTVRAGQEVLLAARVAGDVTGDVIVRGTVAGQPFEQRYPLHLAVSSSPGNGFVPRLWASLAIDELERGGKGDDRARIVALSQGYGVMSRETSLLVLESQAMFDAFGVDRHSPTATWTGEQQLDEVASAGSLPMDAGDATKGAADKAMRAAGVHLAKEQLDDPFAASSGLMGDDDNNGTIGHGAGTGGGTGSGYGLGAGKTPAPATAKPMPTAHATATPAMPAKKAVSRDAVRGRGEWMVRTWERVAAVTPYDAVTPQLARFVATSETALAAAPDSREAHRALVQALSYAGELDRARDVAQRWLDRDRLDPQALGYEADLLGRDGQRDAALRTLAGLVDLEADRVALHERMVRAYEQVGRVSQACAHRIALAALQPKLATASGAAMRCLRTTGRAGDAELVRRALPDDAARAAAEKAATVPAVAARLGGDLVVAAHWTGGADLDLSLVTPDGTRVSWMGGRTDAVITDATSTEREQLAIRLLRRGNYLLEIARATPGTGPVRGTLDVTVLGEKRSLPFELVGTHLTVGRVGVSLVERLVPAWSDGE